MSSVFCGSFKRRVVDYFAGLTTLQRYLFAFFVLLLLSLNIVNAVNGFLRYRHAQSDPMRIRTVEKVNLSDLPPFTVLINSNSILNISCASTDTDCQILAGPFEPYPLSATSISGKNPCLQLHVSYPSFPLLSESLLLTGLTQDQLQNIGYEGLREQSFPAQIPTIAINANGSASGTVILTYSGVRRLNGETEYSVSTQPEVSAGYAISGCYAPEGPTITFSVMYTRSLAHEPWIAMDMQVEQANYTLIDWVSSVATAFNLSLTVVAFLFPLALFIEADEERVDVKGQLAFRLGAKRSTARGSPVNPSNRADLHDQLLEERGLIKTFEKVPL